MMRRDLDREDAQHALLVEKSMVDTLKGLPAFRDWYLGKLDDRLEQVRRRVSAKRLPPEDYAEQVGMIAGLRAARELITSEDQRIFQEGNRLKLGGR